MELTVRDSYRMQNATYGLSVTSSHLNLIKMQTHNETNDILSDRP